MAATTAPHNPMSAEDFANEIRYELKYTQGVTPKEATVDDVYVAAATAVRKHLVDSWETTKQDMVNGNTKAVGYLSAEFLMGRQLQNALLNSGLTDQFNEAVKEFGFEPKDVIDAEYEPGLGNGGLGRLAACFIDSLASLGVPAFGYGIQYQYGIFKQKFDEDGKQVETPDYWLLKENAWGHTDYNRQVHVSFGGEVKDGKWAPAWSVRAIPVDYMVPGYASGRVNTLRLWTAKAENELDLLTFNKSEYTEAVAEQIKAETITKILYPEDSTKVGKQLRLEQQYFFVAASIQDAIRTFYPGQDKPDLTTFPQKICFQLNDTHPVIGIAELMRVLLDNYGYDWNTAWDITSHTFNYTCHTLLPEALEQWPVELISELLPRHMQIIEEIDRHFVEELKGLTTDQEKIDRMRIISTDDEPKVRMAYLATAAGQHVNGVAELHSELLKDVTLKDFSDLYPQKFTN
ncbi:MAG: glycogen/starch/alpha-glucan family phosphorylase, partial [Bifidobacteriaceae bacterium]|nr:glycogen/starch/alpha-glucan family phosphorylase [Bifidobacteriaceae bacterium]